MMRGAARARMLGWAMIGVAGVAGLMGGLTGCVGYASFPYEEGGKNQFATQNPNTPPADELMEIALDWVVSKYPPRGMAVTGYASGGVATEPSFTINVPNGVRRDVYDRILDKLGGKAAPLTPETAEMLPIYHIGRVWIRGREAKVDVLRPVMEGPRGPGGTTLYQPVTLRLEGGFEPWRVRRHQVWEVGTVPVPELYYRPGYDEGRRQYHEQARMPATYPVVEAPEGSGGRRAGLTEAAASADETGLEVDEAGGSENPSTKGSEEGTEAGVVRRRTPGDEPGGR